MTRYRLDLAYDGTAFAGWARQPGLRTVQGVLELWIPRVLRLGDPVRLTCAGRTDSGVHARGQVAHLDLVEPVIADRRAGVRPLAPEEVGTALTRRLARVLPDDVVVRAVRPAPAGFDARFSAVWRRYVYRLWDGEVAVDPLQRGFVARQRERLDVDAMDAAGRPLLGLRDFAAFCKSRPGATTIRTLLDLRTARLSDGQPAGAVEVTVRADAFCHSMVRALVGGLVAVGSGRRPAPWLAAVTAAGERDSAVQVMPAQGLTLEQVGYPDDADLARRAVEARARREPLS